MSSINNIILIKRNDTSGVSPAISSLELGELGLNVADGKLFTKTVVGAITSIVPFSNDNDSPYTLNHYYSSIKFNYGNNTITQIFGSVLGGYKNDISGGGSTVINGENNDIAGDFSLIGSGYVNKISADGDYSFIAAGSGNIINHQNVFILGTDLKSYAPNFTYVNNLSSQGFLYGDGRFITGISSGNNQDSEVRSLTSNYASVYSQVNANSASWGSVSNYQGTDIKALTAFWDDSRTYVNYNSGSLTNIYSLTSNWQSTYAQVSSLSANWGNASTGTLTQELSVIATSQGLYGDGDKIPVGTSIETILINMLKTSIPPIYNLPTLSVAYGSPTVVATYEVGSSVPSFTITPTFNTNDSGGLINFVYYKDSNNLGTGSTKLVSSFTINSSTTLQVSAGYSQGSIKNDNLGNPYPTGRINAGSLTNSATLNVLYPYFWGKSSTQPTAASIASDIQNGSANKVLASASGTVSVTYNANGEYIWLAHTADQTEKTKWYVTALNSGSIGSGQAINSPVTRNVTSPDAYWSGVSFKIYISSGQQATTGAFEYRNS